MSTSKTTPKTAKVFSDYELSAMRERGSELRAEAKAAKNRAEGERIALARIAQMKGLDQTMAKRVHAIVTASAPSLWPKTWYGMPAYANKDGKVVCFFQDAKKFKARYATFGFSDQAKLDDGTMWPTSFALKNLTPADEKTIAALVKKAAS
jgi:uncharacterized protein YdhG (YjbR/CyaY superfamily)